MASRRAYRAALLVIGALTAIFVGCEESAPDATPGGSVKGPSQSDASSSGDPSLQEAGGVALDGSGGSSGSSGLDASRAPDADAAGASGPCAPNPCTGATPVCVLATTAKGYKCQDRCTGVTCTAREACDPATGKCFDPCATANCGPTQVCIATIHGVPSGTCVDGHECDCGNCGNCGAGGTYVGMQAFCGSPGGAPATLACTKACTGGAGCIPFGVDTAGNPASICWPLEGCFSK